MSTARVSTVRVAAAQQRPAQQGPAVQPHAAAPRAARTASGLYLPQAPNAGRGALSVASATAVPRGDDIYVPPSGIVAPMVSMAGEGTDLMNYLLANRIIFIGKPIYDTVAQYVCSSLLALELQNPNEDIMLYINSPGGQMYSIMGIIDMINELKCDVSTVALGTVQSSATLVLAAGAKGKRYAMKNTRIMVNQPIGGCQGSWVDVNIQAAEQNRNLKLTVEVLEKVTGLPRDTLEEAVDRELFLTPEQAIQLKLIDRVIEQRP